MPISMFLAVEGRWFQVMPLVLYRCQIEVGLTEFPVTGKFVTIDSDVNGTNAYVEGVEAQA